MDDETDYEGATAAYSADDREQFATDFWGAMDDVLHYNGGDDNPRKDLDVPPYYPLRWDHDDDEPRYEGERIADPTRADATAGEAFDYLQTVSDACIFVVNQWFAREVLGWGWNDGLFVGRYDGLTSSEKAHKVRDIVAWDERNEDPYFRETRDFETIPVSQVWLATFERPDPTDLPLFASDDVTRGSLADADVTVNDTVSTRYGTKVGLEWCPPWGDTKEKSEAIRADLKGMNWDDVHYEWDGDRSEWLVDADALASVIGTLTAEGWTVGLSRSATDRAETYAPGVAEMIP